ncbi:MAG TPA: PEP-CTERM sorting domain-containing protein [Fimbriimonas sp.]|nr:PEP-CTERM sorting domain-containing protein [Fimbriimonas sp.]
MRRFWSCSGLSFALVSISLAQWTANVLAPEEAWASIAFEVTDAGYVGFAWVIDGHHATLWTGSSLVDLNPTRFNDTYAYGGTRSYQVGGGSGEATGFMYHALKWNGSAASVVDLHPPGFTSSWISDADEEFQTGYGFINETNSHALLWNGTASATIDLNPVGFTNSSAKAMWGGKQFGSGSGVATNNNEHALMWSGTAESVVDLNPPGKDGSTIAGAASSGQIGTSWSEPFGLFHATFWNAIEGTPVDLNPIDYFSTMGYGISSFGQVGAGKATPDSEAHALYWNGSASSLVDLHGSLSGFPNFVASSAFDIDDDGTIVGCAYDRGGRSYAIKWTNSVPEPGSLVGLLFGGIAFFRFRKAGTS